MFGWRQTLRKGGTVTADLPQGLGDLKALASEGNRWARRMSERLFSTVPPLLALADDRWRATLELGNIDSRPSNSARRDIRGMADFPPFGYAETRALRPG